MEETVIAGYARTPFGRYLGALKDLPATELGAVAIREAVRRAAAPVEMIDNAFIGMVVQAGAGQIPSRQATISAGLPETVPSETVNKVCASGLRAVNLGDLLIQARDAGLVVAGGMENMSAVPYYLPQARQGSRMGDAKIVDGMVHDGLWCPFHQVHMGVHGSAVPAEEGVTREMMDHWSLRSHQRAVEASSSGLFEGEIVPLELPRKGGGSLTVSADELPRADCSYEKLSSLPPAFEKEGLITAGNAPAISDGAAALVLASAKTARDLGLPVLARIVSRATASLAPRYIATVPHAAAVKALEKAALHRSEIKLVEINEAFAGVALTVIKLGGWSEEIINVNGGAVALGHPIGASGARILLTLVAELRRRGGGYGLATICSGAAQGEATIIRVD